MKFRSALLTAASGSVGGLTFSHNAGGMYTRGRATPTNPNTSPQQAARAALGSANAIWSAFSAANRQLWEDYAIATSWTGAFGDPIQLTGQQAFLRWGIPRILLGATATTAPAAGVSGFGAPPDSIVASATGPTVTVGVSVGASNSGEAFIRRSGVLPSGVSSVKQPLTLDGTASISQFDTTEAVTPTQTPTAGQRIVYVARIAYDDGRLSQQFSQVVTVGA